MSGSTAGRSKAGRDNFRQIHDGSLETMKDEGILVTRDIEMTSCEKVERSPQGYPKHVPRGVDSDEELVS